MDLEDQKKAILPYLQRAQEIQQADPKVAYYCRLYGVEQALALKQRAKEVNAVLMAAMDSLEKEKAKLMLDPVGDRIHCLGFALRIFDNADRVDRAGKATERTSKAFYAASVFIDILNHFEGGVDAELVEKQRYCLWRAAEIRKALREGRQPLPPPAAGANGGGGGSAASASGGLEDLPPASGSSAWAYGGSGQAPAAAAPPQPQPQPQPPQPTAVAAGGPSGLGAPPGISGRFWPGCRLRVRTDEGLEGASGEQAPGSRLPLPPAQVQQGTVGQVVQRPDGGISYKVALRDRLLEVPEEAAVPELAEGAPAAMRQQPSAPPQPVTVLLVNDMSWPPTFLVKTVDGREVAAEAQQLGPPLPLPPTPAPGAAAHPPSSAPVLGSPLDRSLGSGSATPPPPAPPSAPSAPFAPSYPSIAGAHPAPPPPAQGYAQSVSWPHPASASAAAPSNGWAPPPPLPAGYKPPLKTITDAQKQAKYAVSALSFEDIPTAVKHLTEALQLLTNPQHTEPQHWK
ncbi:hypothetical protein GPECTOR_40g571 [Gonium pectorale]|uniref:Vta1/callose synthase N-terminal domain-containing protein n=1 Tax=Gonium pectorale TaxID=33097 RepID=A0A150GAG3_GONPE|nr:hypothetical protein GPECTOR_40g571 [Gonium pectorale]|eukprot:KXZ46837.1 hypothetical protein GPECTOR_40g571 [Gonium pectorale]